MPSLLWHYRVQARPVQSVGSCMNASSSIYVTDAWRNIVSVQLWIHSFLWLEWGLECRVLVLASNNSAWQTWKSSLKLRLGRRLIKCFPFLFFLFFSSSSFKLLGNAYRWWLDPITTCWYLEISNLLLDTRNDKVGRREPQCREQHLPSVGVFFRGFRKHRLSATVVISNIDLSTLSDYSSSYRYPLVS
jgi:hypothetical protein